MTPAACKSPTPALINPTAPHDVRVLPPHVVNRIAAGEVVERPASAVKELIENAIDAGATTVAITASHGGRTIRVADNGCGMTPDNAKKAFLNHATSKIISDKDLERIGTFGFRGEALASIAAVSEMTCQTRTADAEHGTQISVADDGTPQASPVGCSVGTVMSLSRLFDKVPGRLKFLKKSDTEVGNVRDVVKAVALANPGIRFQLTLDERLVVNTTGSGDLATAFAEIYKIPHNSPDFLTIHLDGGDGYAVTGLASLPSVTRSTRKFMLTYVNGRPITCQTLNKAIMAAYESLLEHKKYPFVCLFVTLPLDEVDVNVHPTKREVRYAQGNQVFGLVKSALRQALESHGIFPKPPSAFPMGQSPRPALSPVAYSSTGHYPSSGMAAAPTPTNGAMAVQSPLWATGASTSETTLTTEAVTETPEVLSDATMAQRVKVIGQLFNTYILLETPQGLMVVDQHIASERTVFEALKTAEANQTIDTQQVLASEVLALSTEQRGVLVDNQPQLQQLGFTYQLTDDGVQLTGVPTVYLDKHDPSGWFVEVLDQLADEGQASLDIDHLLATMSCHRAVRAGDVLTHAEMETVIQRWLACKLPWTCPHGRPIAHTIQADELNRFFHRPSLPVNAF